MESPNASPHQGVFRTKPGGLAVSRTLGDVEAKVIDFGGKPNVILNLPDVIGLKIDPSFDFLVMGSDGIYDRMTNRDIIINVIETSLESIKNNDEFDIFLRKSVQNVLKLCVEKDSKDNISCVILYFENFAFHFKNKELEFFLQKLALIKYASDRDDKILKENVIFKQEVEEVLINNYITNDKSIIIQKMNNNIEVKKNFKFFCCGLFCKKKKKYNDDNTN
jgi:hypothetical protein